MCNVRFVALLVQVWCPLAVLTLQVPYHEMLQRVKAACPALHRMNDPAGEVAKNFTAPGFLGSVSFISSMTEHFCGDCNR